MTVTAKDTGRTYHTKSEADAKKLEKLHEMFKHMRENGYKKK